MKSVTTRPGWSLLGLCLLLVCGAVFAESAPSPLSNSSNPAAPSVTKAPEIFPIPDQTVKEETTLSLIIIAKDRNRPPSPLTFSLAAGAPAGASIDSVTGAFTWTPDETQGTGVYPIGVVASIDATPSLSTTNMFTVTVNEVNSAPALAVIANQTVNELSTLAFAVSASDADVPAQILTYSLVSGAPAGAGIDPVTGVFAWTPGETQGPGSYTIGVSVSDNGTPALSATNVFTVTVNEVNSAPVLTTLANQTVNELSTVTFTVGASDADVPAQVLSFALGAGAPAGASIDPVTGVFAWTPDEPQGPEVLSLDVIVTDNGTPTLSATNTFSITVNEVNSAPTLAAVANQTVNELSALTLTVSASDADVPAQALTFALASGAPVGASIDPVTGVFTWTPDETQGPGIFSVGVTVTDNGTPSLSATNTFSVSVNEVNSTPTLAAITSQTVNELSTLTFTVNASDADMPSQTLTFSLAPNAPAGASIDPTTGVFTWTPTEAQGPGSYIIGVIVSDNGTPPLSATNTFSVTVNEVNNVPVLTTIANQTVNELSAFAFAISASDADVPAQILTFSLAPGAPAGASIDPATGVFTWTPTETQGPGSYTFDVSVSDNGTPALSVTNTFSITVNEVNSAPTLAVVASQTVNELSTLTFAVSASDADVPVQALTFSLAPGAPAGASIDPTTGVFTWTPDETQGPGAYTIGAIASDNGTPPLSVTNVFTVTVNEVNSAPVLATVANQTVNELSALTFTVSASDVDVPAQPLSFALGARAPAGAGIDLVTGLFTWTPAAGQGGSNYLVTIIVSDSGSPPQSDSKSFTVTVKSVNSPPVLAAIARQTINELSTLTLTVHASDAELPAQTLTYALGAGAPAGASINPVTGVFSWTPDEAQGPGVFPIAVIVSDNGVPSMSATNIFTVTVNEVNSAPSLAAIPNQYASSGSVVAFSVNASDADLPAQQLTFSLDAGAPAGAALDSRTGQFLWFPTKAQMGQIYTVTVSVTDDGSPPLSATRIFTINANDQNSLPALRPISDRSIVFGETLVVTTDAQDPDQPYQNLSFSLGSGSPADASIHPTTGVFTWTPTESDIGTTNHIVIRVTDNGAPPLSASRTFAVRVLDVSPVSSPAESLPVIDLQLGSTNVTLGGRVMFSIAASGTPPLAFQWRHNGLNITNATNAVFIIDAVQLADGGSYNVAVANATGATDSQPIELVVQAPLSPAGDNFGNRTTLSSRTVSGNNFNARSEPGEPRHAGKAGGKSVWYKWSPGRDGLATFETTGSTFDTLLAVYTGTRVDQLTPVAANEDSGGYFTSLVQFDAKVGTEYAIAVDGFGGAEGNIILSWDLTAALAASPQIVTGPKSQSVAQNDFVTFSVIARDPGSQYQWFFNGQAIGGANQSTYTIFLAQPVNVGNYFVRVTLNDQSVDSAPARLEMLVTEQTALVPPQLSEDKLEDLIPLKSPLQLQRAGHSRLASAGSLSRGYTARYLFNTQNATRQAGEPNHCGVIAGASQWYALTNEVPGKFTLRTTGSEFETVLAVYTLPRNKPLNVTNLVLETCDNHGTNSVVRFDARPGTTYYVVVDGVKGAKGSAQLNVNFDVLSQVTAPRRLLNGNFGFKLISQPGALYRVEASSDLANWTPILTTNLPAGELDFEDPNSGKLPMRWYRVVQEQ